MDQPLQPLEHDLDALRAAWSDAMPAFGALAGGAQVELEQMSDAGLVRVADLVARIRRDADGLLARVGNEVARRSGPEFGDTGLAKQQGFHNPARLEAHHIRWWERDAGPTDLENGVLLCSFCHHGIHRENWEIRATRDRVWFIPPPHIDPARTPRLGGKARFALPDTFAA